MENYLKEMLVTLTDAGVEFVVGGGVACVLHGVERVTLDLDIAVEMTASNLDRLVNAVEKLKLQPRVPVSLADIGDPDFVHSMVIEKGALVFSLTDFGNPLRHLDIFLSPALSFERLSEGANWVEIGGTKVRVASKELLIKIKNEIKPLRPKDLLDMQELSRLIGEHPG
jgi:predicted nucleotidyltransferase